MTDLIDWVEKQAQENLRSHLQTMEHLVKEANATLVLLLAGVGGSAAFVVKLLESEHLPMQQLSAAVAFGVWLMIAAALLVQFCLKIGNYPAPANEPRAIFRPLYSLDDIRRVELGNMQERIDQAARRNSRVATWLNAVRYLAILSPIAAAGAAYLDAVGRLLAPVG